MTAQLPARSNLDWLRKAAKDRLRQLRESRPEAKLAEAQLAIAREHGFPSWRKLKAHVEAADAPSDPPPPEAVVAAFLRRVGTGRIAEARALLDEHPRLVNAVGPHPFWGGRPQALHVAVEGRRRDIFDLLVDRGADVNGSNDQYDHWSPLMLAIDRDSGDMRDELIARGARVGLLEALMLGDDARVEELLRPGVLPDIAPNGGSFLAFARTPFAVDRLLALGASPDMRDRWGSTAIDAISRMGPRGRDLVQHMVARGVPAAPKEYARLGDLDTLSRLVRADPSVARLDSVMMAAVDFRHHGLVEWLLAHGANANARADARSRHTALHSAAWNGDLKMVRLLLGAGADPAARDDEHNGTPLGWATTSIEVSNNPACAEVAAFLERGETQRDEG
jgi:ankyrin repeat protein